MIDNIMKIGGSILYDMDKTRRLLKIIENSKEHTTAYTIGSGHLGEEYKKWVKDQNGISMPFTNSIMAWSNIQSINANIISAINGSFVVCQDKKSAEEALTAHKRPILDARGFHKYFEDLKYQTTDVRTAKLCYVLGARNLIVVTDVNGIYTSDPKKSLSSKKITLIEPEELMSMGRTSVDKGLAETLIDYDLKCYVVGVDSILASRQLSKDTIKGMGTTIQKKGGVEK